MKQQTIEPIVNAINNQNDPLQVFILAVSSGLVIAFTTWLTKKSREKL